MRLRALAPGAEERETRVRLRDERGLTLIELVIAMVLTLVIAGAAMTFMIVTLHQENVVASRSFATRQSEVALQRLTRELRQAQDILSTSTGSDTTPVNVTYGGGTSSVSFYLPAAGSTAAGTLVTWTCTTNANCTRTACAASVVVANACPTGSSTVTITELTGVSSATITPFGASGTQLASGAGSGANPSYPSLVNITLQTNPLSQAGTTHTSLATGLTTPIIVQDGVALRSYSS
ncbi:MAG: prepilin-type N-terminal cleavage/methylation domain-containing protein [Actinomycetota bacterium]|nr:prepilin-type N-terminal cleavage/methylation domain-containing protein [Actinomycetota bacterium]